MTSGVIILTQDCLLSPRQWITLHNPVVVLPHSALLHSSFSVTMLRDQGEKIGNFDPTDNLEKLSVSRHSSSARASRRVKSDTQWDDGLTGKL